MNRVRRAVIWVICLASVWLILSASIGVVAIDAALHPVRRPILDADEALAQSIAVRDHAALTSVSIVANDGVILRAWLFALPGSNSDAAILVHGQSDNRAGMLGNADMLLRHGYSILLPDARAHGASGGPIATYGLMEAEDLRRWYRWLQQTLAPDCVDGLGDSMGAAILLQAVAVEPGFCAVVAESPFASFREASYDRLGEWFQTGAWLGRTLLRPAVTADFLYARLKYKVDFERASPAKAVATTRVPILLIHGQADTNLPPWHSEQIKAGNPTVVLWEPPGANHCGASTVAPAEYERRAVGWFDDHQLRPGRASLGRSTENPEKLSPRHSKSANFNFFLDPRAVASFFSSTCRCSFFHPAGVRQIFRARRIDFIHFQVAIYPVNSRAQIHPPTSCILTKDQFSIAGAPVICHAHIRSHRHRFQLMQNADRQGCRARAENSC